MIPIEADVNSDTSISVYLHRVYNDKDSFHKLAVSIQTSLA